MKNVIQLKWLVHNFKQFTFFSRHILDALYCIFSFTFVSQTTSYVRTLQRSQIIVIFLLLSNFSFAQINFTNSQAANLVVGQANFTANVAGCTQNGLYAPSYTAISSKGVLAVSEQTGGRVKLWNPTPTANGANASVVVGKNNFNDCTNTGANQTNVSNSNGVAFSPESTVCPTCNPSGAIM